MSTANGRLFIWRLSSPLEDHQGVLLIYSLAIFSGLVLLWVYHRSPKFPELNPKNRFEFSDIARLRSFMRNSIDVLKRGRTLFPTKPYRLFSDWGELTILPLESINEIKGDKRFDFGHSASDDAHGYLPGFEGFIFEDALPTVVTKYLTRSLTKLTGPLMEEASLVIRQVLTDSPDWGTLKLQPDIMKIVSRMSSRVFMGKELCRDEQWNKAVTNYSINMIVASDVLREYPRWMRPFVHWFLPCCTELRGALADARAQLAPHIRRRDAVKREAVARGEQCPFDDSIEWLAQAGSVRDPADSQITLSMVAIQTTSDLLASTLVNLAQHPELIGQLREEVVRVLGNKAASLHDLKLMDSVFKETQRLKPVALTWKRMATEDVKLASSGLTVKKNTKVAVGMTHMWSNEYYGPNAGEFDGHRFERMRDTPGHQHTAHLVSTSPGHLGFGHGVHACPGRFFAANEVKIALSHLILKYDWKLPEGRDEVSALQPVAMGMAFGMNPTAKLMFRRREEELDFGKLEY